MQSHREDRERKGHFLHPCAGQHLQEQPRIRGADGAAHRFTGTERNPARRRPGCPFSWQHLHQHRERKGVRHARPHPARRAGGSFTARARARKGGHPGRGLGLRARARRVPPVYESRRTEHESETRRCSAMRKAPHPSGKPSKPAWTDALCPPRSKVTFAVSDPDGQRRRQSISPALDEYPQPGRRFQVQRAEHADTLQEGEPYPRGDVHAVETGTDG